MDYFKFDEKENVYVVNGKKYDPFDAEYYATKNNLKILHAEMKKDSNVKKMVNKLVSYLQNKSYNNGIQSENEQDELGICDPNTPKEKEEARLDDLASILGYRSYL